MASSLAGERGWHRWHTPHFLLCSKCKKFFDKLPAEEEGAVAGHLAAQSQDGAL